MLRSNLIINLYNFSYYIANSIISHTEIARNYKLCYLQ